MSKGLVTDATAVRHDELSERDSPVSVLPPTGSAHFETEVPVEEKAPVKPQTLRQWIGAAPWFPHIVLLFCQLSFASMHVTSHAALHFIPPMVYATFRIGLALPLLVVSARVQEPEFRLMWSDLPWFAVLGALGVGIPQSFVFIGNKLAGAAYAGIFTPTVPVYVAILTALLRIEPFTLIKGFGTGLSIAGAFILVHIDRLDIHKANTRGMLALITLNACYALYLVSLSRYLQRRPYPFSFFASASTFGVAYIGVFAAHEFPAVDWSGVPWGAWAALLWAAWGTSFAAHSGVSWAVGRTSAVVPSIYSCMQPVLTVSLAAAYLGQTLAGRDYAAMGLVICGVAFVISAKLKEDARRRASREAEYELVGRRAGKLQGDGGDGGRGLRRVVSHWEVPDLDSTGHIIARARSSANLAAYTQPDRKARRGDAVASDDGSDGSDGSSSCGGDDECQELRLDMGEDSQAAAHGDPAAGDAVEPPDQRRSLGQLVGALFRR